VARNTLRKALTVLALGAGLCVAFGASAENFEASFDQTLGTELRTPPSFQQAGSSPLEQRIALLANSERGRIGVAAIDLSTGERISVLGDQRFPLASTSKIAIAATFLDGVDKGKWKLDDRFPLLVRMASKKLSGPAPLREGSVFSARELIEMMITRSNNQAADGLLHVVGGPAAVNAWVHDRAGIQDFSINRYISTLVRDDGEFDPADHIDTRDSASPLAMAQLVKGLHDGRWLSQSSRDVLLGAMARCKTGPQRIPGQMPDDVLVAHKTGSLYDTSSDVGIVTGPDGHAIALAIYVTGGQNDHRYRYDRIALIARAIYDGYADSHQVWLTSAYAKPGAP
jgi:beta-lactamase class A